MNRSAQSLIVVAAQALVVGGVVGAIGLGVLAFRNARARDQLELRLQGEARRAEALSHELSGAQDEARRLGTRVQSLEGELGTAKAGQAAAEQKAAALDQDLGQARAKLTLYEENARALTAEISNLRQDVAEIRSASVSPEAVAAYKATITELERQLATLKEGAAAPGAQAASTAVFTSRVGVARVLSVGPGNAFVVLNFGRERGGAVGQKLTVKQGTEVAATVQISDVRPNFSIAQVLPETARALLQKGDVAVLIR